jgi:hypothetical protein
MTRRTPNPLTSLNRRTISLRSAIFRTIISVIAMAGTFGLSFIFFGGIGFA